MGKSNDLFNNILRHAPSQGTLLLVLTKMKEEGRFKEVLQECIKASQRYPDDIRLRFLLAESYMEVGFLGQAEAELNKVVSEIDTLVLAYKLQARLYTRQHKAQEAHEALKRYLAHIPDDREALDLLGTIEPREQGSMSALPGPTDNSPAGAPEEKGEMLSQLETPTLAEIYYKQGQIREAVSTYERALSRNPNDKGSMARLAELKALIAETEATQMTDKERPKDKREKMIVILEAWLTRIKELNHV